MTTTVVKDAGARELFYGALVPHPPRIRPASAPHSPPMSTELLSLTNEGEIPAPMAHT